MCTCCSYYAITSCNMGNSPLMESSRGGAKQSQSLKRCAPTQAPDTTGAHAMWLTHGQPCKRRRQACACMLKGGRASCTRQLRSVCLWASTATASCANCTPVHFGTGGGQEAPPHCATVTCAADCFHNRGPMALQFHLCHLWQLVGYGDLLSPPPLVPQVLLQLHHGCAQ